MISLLDILTFWNITNRDIYIKDKNTFVIVVILLFKVHGKHYVMS